jgi:hypothetical protein
MIGRRWWLILAGLSIVLVSVFLAACGGGDGESSPKDGHYANAKYRYKFDYPKSWGDVTKALKIEVREGEPVVLDRVAVGSIEADVGLLDGVQVAVVQINHEVTADGLERELTDLDALFQTFASQVAGNLKPPQTVELGGLKARQYVIEFAYLGRIQAASAQTVTFFGDRQYTVNCEGRASSFNADVLPGCEQILQTFRFQ